MRPAEKFFCPDKKNSNAGGGGVKPEQGARQAQGAQVGNPVSGGGLFSGTEAVEDDEQEQGDHAQAREDEKPLAVALDR